MYYSLLLASTFIPGEDSLEPTASWEEVTLMGVISMIVTACPSQSSNHTAKIAANSSIHRGNPACSKRITQTMGGCTHVFLEKIQLRDKVFILKILPVKWSILQGFGELAIAHGVRERTFWFLSIYICNVLLSTSWSCYGQRGWKRGALGTSSYL